jgi:IclR family acetate operon transcriptional repressor
VTEPAGRPLATVARAIALLETLAEAREPLGTVELARRTGVNASTVSRLLGTLLAAGLVERDAASGRFGLGLRLVQLGNAALARLDLRALARPLLVELARVSGETATLSLPAAGDAVTADAVASSRSVISQPRVGRASVPHATAVGKLLLAYVPGALDALADPLERYTPRTITDRAALAEAVAAARRQGWAEAEGEREEGLSAIAVPVLDGRGDLAAIFGVQGPERLDAAARAAALPALRDAAARLGARLAGA